MDNLKTDHGYYNEDDFVQKGEQLEELTVTITLCEYRNLIVGAARQELEIDRLCEERDEIKKKLDSLTASDDAVQKPEG